MSTPSDQNPPQHHTHTVHYQQQPVQPVYMTTPAPAAQPYPQNGMATAGLVLGIVATAIALIPFGIFFIWPASILAIIFGAIGHNKANQGWSTKKRQSIIGWVLGIVSMVIAPVILWMFLAIGIMGSAGMADACPDTPAVAEPCDIY